MNRMRNTNLKANLVKVPVALVLAFAIVLHEVPARAAGPDLAEARRRFVAAVHRSDQAVAAAEAALEDLIGKTAALLAGGHQQQLDALQKMLKAIRDFKAEKQRILAQDQGTYDKLLRAGADYARACQTLAAVLAVTVAVVVTVVAIVGVVFTGGTGLAVVAIAVAVVGAIVNLTTVLINSLPEILRALGLTEGADALDRWKKENPALATTVAVVQAVGAIVVAVASAAVSLRTTEAAARDAQARLQAMPKPAGPALAESKKLDLQVPATFDGDLGGSFHVKLENGQVTRPAGQAVLRGTIAITSTSNASVKLTLDGDATLSAGGGGAWASLRGHGTARLSGFGPVLTIPNATVASQGVSVFTLLGDGIPVRGCTHSVEAGSLFASTRISLAGSLRCGPWTLTASTLALSGGGVSGGGVFTAWSKTFTMTYAASGDGLVARGSISGPDTPWTGIPRVDAEYRIERPKLDVKLEGPSLAPTFGAGKILVRSKATKPDGSPWSSASLTPDVMRMPAPPAGAVPVPFPNLPKPDDVLKGARDACEAVARNTLLGRARDRALEACRSANPSPPGVPALPNKLEVPVGEIFR